MVSHGHDVIAHDNPVGPFGKVQVLEDTGLVNRLDGEDLAVSITARDATRELADVLV
ncbi:MAG: hypothetical protein RI563_13210 [Thiohalophilus sp.]|uniref:hypothetical protein n=1 Tax=Thiohalophilus sp. TaxID=3028392 RepID=UPI002870A3EB|nr:hypothetical protein [Thiohalophilus sp.]MDR9437835.1 hypothetical protein [Thiohalophilus sp.]